MTLRKLGTQTKHLAWTNISIDFHISLWTWGIYSKKLHWALVLFDLEQQWRKFLRNAFPFVLYVKNNTALATELECAIKYPKNCMNLIAFLPFPVAIVSKMLDKNTNIVAVMENAKKHIVIPDDNLIIALLVPCITAWLLDSDITFLIALTEAICIHAMILIEIKSITLPKIRISKTFWRANPITFIDARNIAKQ